MKKNSIRPKSSKQVAKACRGPITIGMDLGDRTRNDAAGRQRRYNEEGHGEAIQRHGPSKIDAGARARAAV